MKDAALVLSGGGAKGAFQVGAERVFREEAGYRWRVIAGVSVGALNGTMLATARHERLEHLWRTITQRDIYRKRFWLWTALRVLFGARGLFDNRPLKRLIAREIDPARLQTEIIVGAVDLESGRYLRFTTQEAREDPAAFKEAVFASTCIPVLWPPTRIGERYVDAVDGGLRSITPLGDVIDYDPEEVVIINTEPRRKAPTDQRLDNLVKVAERSLEIVLDEIFQRDLREFLRINELVIQAEVQGFRLYKADSTPFRRYRCTIIEPAESLGHTLDFSRASLGAWLALGEARAREALRCDYTATTLERRA